MHILLILFNAYVRMMYFYYDMEKVKLIESLSNKIGGNKFPEGKNAVLHPLTQGLQYILLISSKTVFI